MLLVCLAKSKKYGGRCIAGVEVVPAARGHRLLRRGGEPRWVRPVTDSGHGEVPAQLVANISLLDVVDFPDVRAMPSGYQTENVLLGDAPHRTVRSLPKTEAVLRQFKTTRNGPLFGNRGKAVPADQVHTLNHSLLLIQPGDVAFRRVLKQDGTSQLRARFCHGAEIYDLPVTDPEFAQEFARLFPHGPAFSSCYLTLSLGMEHEGWHSKLVAGVFLQ